MKVFGANLAFLDENVPTKRKFADISDSPKFSGGMLPLPPPRATTPLESDYTCATKLEKSKTEPHFINAKPIRDTTYPKCL